MFCFDLLCIRKSSLESLINWGFYIIRLYRVLIIWLARGVNPRLDLSIQNISFPLGEQVQTGVFKQDVENLVEKTAWHVSPEGTETRRWDLPHLLKTRPRGQVQQETYSRRTRPTLPPSRTASRTWGRGCKRVGFGKSVQGVQWELVQCSSRKRATTEACSRRTRTRVRLGISFKEDEYYLNEGPKPKLPPLGRRLESWFGLG